jgi:hypothetical protein
LLLALSALTYSQPVQSWLLLAWLKSTLLLLKSAALGNQQDHLCQADAVLEQMSTFLLLVCCAASTAAGPENSVRLMAWRWLFEPRTLRQPAERVNPMAALVSNDFKIERHTDDMDLLPVSLQGAASHQQPPIISVQHPVLQSHQGRVDACCVAAECTVMRLPASLRQFQPDHNLMSTILHAQAVPLHDFIG